MEKGPRNDLSAAVPKFCLALEEFRRTTEGRVRTSQELLSAFFPHDDKTCTDRMFKHLPNEVRGPVVAAWGIRGMKAALRDDDARIQQVVHDALVAGDVDHQAFEEGLSPEILVRWLPLGELWAFWRGGKLSKSAIHKAMATAYELYLFDARWFLDTLSAKGGSLKGTDVLADGLTKDDLTQWVRKIHEGGDGSPKGLVAALGWDKIVAKTPNEVLVSVLDAVVAKVGLVVAAPRDASKAPPEPVKTDAKADGKGPEPKADAKSEPKLEPKSEPKLEAKVDAKIEAKADAPAEGKDRGQRPTDRPADDASGWSSPPPPEPAEDGINVVLDDELMGNGNLSPATSPRMLAAQPVPSDEEDTEVKILPRSQPPPAGKGRSR